MSLPSELTAVLRRVFGDAWHITNHDGAVVGEGVLGSATIALVGTADSARIGIRLALALSRHILDIVEQHPGRPILMLVDNSGQMLSKRDELLGLAGYLAHLASCMALARSRRHRTIGLIYGSAVSGGFMATGMTANACYALSGTEIRVMRLDAMARITRIPQDRLEILASTLPVLSSGSSAFAKLGAIGSVWTNLAADLSIALAADNEHDDRDLMGKLRGGRLCAYETARRVQEMEACDC